MWGGNKFGGNGAADCAFMHVYGAGDIAQAHRHKRRHAAFKKQVLVCHHRFCHAQHSGCPLLCGFLQPARAVYILFQKVLIFFSGAVRHFFPIAL